MSRCLFTSIRNCTSELHIVIFRSIWEAQSGISASVLRSTSTSPSRSFARSHKQEKVEKATYTNTCVMQHMTTVMCVAGDTGSYKQLLLQSEKKATTSQTSSYPLLHIAQDIQIGHARLHHDQISTFTDIPVLKKARVDHRHRQHKRFAPINQAYKHTTGQGSQ